MTSRWPYNLVYKKKKETAAMLVYQENPVGIENFSRDM